MSDEFMGSAMNGAVLDDFEDLSGWIPVTSGLAELTISSAPGPDDGAAMRLDFDFKGGGGFVVARKALSHPMPESFTLGFAVRGVAPANRLELKLADPGGRNVWWRHWDAYQPPADWQRVRVRSSEIVFAYGPAGGGVLAELGAVELAIAAGPGGAGTVWIAELAIEDRTYRATPIVSASSASPGCDPAYVLDGDRATSWRSAPAAGVHRLEIDFRAEREYGGLVVQWHPSARPRAFRVEISDDGSVWTEVHAAQPGAAERSYVYLPGTQSRFLRLTLEAATDGGCGISDLAVQPFEFSRSVHAFFEHVAGSEPRGYHPRWLAREQTYWTPVGLADGNTCAIMNEEGMVEVDRGTFSIEPFVHAVGRLLTWADVEVCQALEDGWMPIPSSVWRSDELTLRTTAFAARWNGQAVLYLRYRLDTTGEARRVRLFAAMRPYQVNPPWQAFGELGGMRRIEELAWDGEGVWVDGARVVVPLTPPSGFGAAAFEQGEIGSYLARGELPAQAAVSDRFGYASGALAFDVELAPGASGDVYLAIPFGAAPASAAQRLAGAGGGRAFDAVARDWHERFGAALLDLPPAAHDHADAMRTAAAQILVNRDGAALQPGPRRYTRSWIRDGAIMAAALLRTGQSAAACEFARWYATHQAADGNVPCCVDANGPDWLAEHDSHGELIFTVMDCFRFIRDRAFLAELWPAVRKAVDYLEALRATRLGAEFDAPALLARRGLLPESVSHEGYLAQPVHSYWDDFWALQGYRDAAAMADVLGESGEQRRIAAARDALRSALRESIERTIAERAIDYVPGSVEWADFDPTATANAVLLLDAADDLPRAALERTFDQYMTGLRRRRAGEVDWNNYSAYEIRIVGALVRLGRRDDANELMDFLLGDRRPRAWNQWPEISWRDPRSPGHLGDVPHTWIGAEYVLALRSMLVYERPSDASLVLAAGIPAPWLDGGHAVAAAGLPTHHGALELRLGRDDPDTVVVSVAGDLEVPAGGIVLCPPLARPLAGVEVNGRPVDTFDARSATIEVCPARVVLRSRGGG
jgi:F5/8 type C domain